MLGSNLMTQEKQYLQYIHRGHRFEFGGNWPCEVIAVEGPEHLLTEELWRKKRKKEKEHRAYIWLIEVRWPSSVGMEPVSWLLDRSRLDTRVRSPSSVGMVPVSWHDVKTLPISKKGGPRWMPPVRGNFNVNFYRDNKLVKFPNWVGMVAESGLFARSLMFLCENIYFHREKERTVFTWNSSVRAPPVEWGWYHWTCSYEASWKIIKVAKLIRRVRKEVD